MEEVNLDSIISQYKIRWRIETMFRVQDECRIKTKSKMIEVRYLLFADEQLIEVIRYLFYNTERSFKRFLIELSDACTTMVDNEERNGMDDHPHTGSIQSCLRFLSFFSTIIAVAVHKIYLARRYW